MKWDYKILGWKDQDKGLLWNSTKTENFFSLEMILEVGISDLKTRFVFNGKNTGPNFSIFEDQIGPLILTFDFILVYE